MSPGEWAESVLEGDAQAGCLSVVENMILLSDQLFAEEQLQRYLPIYLRGGAGPEEPGAITMATTSSVFGKGLGLVLVQYEYEYQGRDGTPVAIKPNERYILLAKTNDHWWQVRRDNSSKPIYIPAKYVKELPPDFPSPLDFADPPTLDPVPLPVAAPVPVPIPIPKTLEEPSGTKTRPGDEVTIQLRPDASTGYRKTDNRMSTFGVPLDFHDLAVPTSHHPGNPPGGPPETATTTTSGTTNMVDDPLNKKHLQVFSDDHKDSGKHRVPSFSPADPLAALRTQTQPIPVETPVAPPSLTGPKDKEESPRDSEEEVEEEASEEESKEERSGKEEDSNHIYESIQDLNLDLNTLLAGKETPGAPALDPPTQDRPSDNPSSPIYANVPSQKKTSLQQNSGSAQPVSPPPDPAHSVPDHTPSSSVSSTSMISPASPVSPQDGWQVHTDQDSGKAFYFHPVTRQTTWSDPHDEGGPLPAPAPAPGQGSGSWEKLMDEEGRVYFHDPSSGATSWTVPGTLSPSTSSSPPGPAHRRQDDGPPPLPEEDYPVDASSDNDAVFTKIPRAQPDLKDGNVSKRRQQELPSLPQRLVGNGVSEPGKPVRSWRHSLAEDTFAPSHRRNFSDFTDLSNRSFSPESPQFSDRNRLKRNLSNRSADSQQHCHLLEKAGILNKTKVADGGKRIRKNWSQSWTVLHGGILTFHKDPRSAPTGNASKSSQIMPEYTVELRGASVFWAARDKSSKKNVLELKTRQGCEYLMQYDTESIITDWFKVIQDTVRQLEQDRLSEDEDEAASDKEDSRRTSTRSSSGSSDSEQRRVRTKLRRFLQRRPTLQSVKERGYIRDNVFGCHLDTLCHRESATIPKFVEKCVRTVERRGLDVDGIYRVSGNLAVIQKLRHKADHEEQLDLEDGQWEEIHVITGALKLFLRELPEPLFPFSCFDKFIAAVQVQDYGLRVSYMRDLVRSLPLPNHDTMELLFKHLRRVVEHKESNRMSVQGIAIVFGPTLLRPQVESANMTIHMVFQSQIVELMLNELETVFAQT
ncbi:rho GTPase-activating protein 27 [Brachionichthys hirsutus]|uniref:rho GTPase-activating protein 27 n=1 Tax=Brachionichthys hirsutus TaxID=412623 RepID=UPI003604AC82